MLKVSTTIGSWCCFCSDLVIHTQTSYHLIVYSLIGETMIKIIKHDFGLTIDIEELINKIDTDGSGEIEFDEFSLMLGK